MICFQTNLEISKKSKKFDLHVLYVFSLSDELFNFINLFITFLKMAFIKHTQSKNTAIGACLGAEALVQL